MASANHSQKKRENYFILLELDPSEEDWRVIEQRLLAKKRKWSREAIQGNSTQQKISKANLKLVDDIERVMSDPAERAREAEIASRQIHEKKSAAIDRLNRMIGALRQKGYCSEAHLAKMVKDLNGLLSLDEVKEALKVAGIPLGEAKDDSGTERSGQYPRLESTTQRNIRSNLDYLHLDSLYAFLGLGSTSKAEALRQKADEINKEILRSGSTDSRSGARKELAGIAMSLFRNEEGKRRYDNTREAEKLAELHGMFESAGHDRIIDQQTLAFLVTSAEELGVEHDFATVYILEYAARRKWRVFSTDSAPAKTKDTIRMCPFCGTMITNSEEQTCSHCGEELVAQCPGCGQQNPARRTDCVNCGYDLSQLASLRVRIQEIRAEMTRGELQTAREACDKIRREAPNFQQAEVLDRELRDREREKEEAERALLAQKQELENLIASRNWDKASELLGRIQSALDAEERRGFGEEIHQGKVDAVKVRLGDLIDSRELFKARAVLSEQKGRLEAGDYTKYEKEIDIGIDASSKWLSSTPAVVPFIVDAWNKCKDNPQFRGQFKAYPPPSSSSLVVTQETKGFGLTWQAGTNPNDHLLDTKIGRETEISYVIVRSSDSCPRTPKEGATIGETKATEWMDQSIETGAGYYYAVFTKAKYPAVFTEAKYPLEVTVFSEEAADSGPTPQVWAPPPEEVRAIPDDGRIVITWRKPKNSIGTIIFRYPNSEYASAIGGAMVDGEQYEDVENVVYGERRYYKLIAVYPGQKREEVKNNKPARVNVMLEPAPPTVTLQGSYDPPYVVLEYEPPKGCTVTLYGGQGEVPLEITHTEGEQQKIKPIRALGRELTLEDQQELNGIVQGRVRGPAAADSGYLHWFAAVSKGIERENASDPIMVLLLEEVRGLKVGVPDDSGVPIEWEWPDDGTEKAHVSWGPVVAGRREKVVGFAEFDRAENEKHVVAKVIESVKKFPGRLTGKNREESDEKKAIFQRSVAIEGDGLYEITVHTQRKELEEKSAGVSARVVLGPRDVVEYWFRKSRFGNRVQLFMKNRGRRDSLRIPYCYIRYRTDRAPNSINDGEKVMDLVNVNPDVESGRTNLNFPIDLTGSVYLAVFVGNEAFSRVRLIPRPGESPVVNL